MKGETKPGARIGTWEAVALAAILLLAAFLRFWHLGQVGFGNVYYAAAVRSMLTSASNFFFVSFDPAGVISVDKPPVALWVQGLSAKLFGYHGLSLIVPQGIAGVISVVLLYRLIRPAFGVAAGLMGALFLAISPINVAVDRSNNPDSLLILTLLAATTTAVRYTQTGRWGWLCLTAFWMGIAFNIKMLAAFLLLPALAWFCVSYLLMDKRTALVARWGQLGVVALILAGTTLSWSLAVDATPPNKRPYVGGSKTNSALELAFGYNGIGRVAGGQGPGSRFGRGPGNGGPPQGAMGFPGMVGSMGMPGPPAGGFGGPGGPGGRGGIMFGGEAGPLRLLQAGLIDQFAWGLPLAVLGAVALGSRLRFRKPMTMGSRELLLWTGWAVTHALVFSFARGIFHPYYLSALAPALAALGGIGFAALAKEIQEDGWRGWLLPITFLVTAVWQVQLLIPYSEWNRVLIPVILSGVFVAIVPLVLMETQVLPYSGRGKVLGTGAISVGLAALSLTPLLWAGTVTFGQDRAMMPMAGPDLMRQGGGFGPGMGPGGPGRDERVDTKLMTFLQSQKGDSRILMVTGSVQNVSSLIIASGMPVVGIGGFMGEDQPISLTQFQAMAARGEVRFVLIGGRGGLRGGGSNNAIFEWAQQVGKPVDSSLWQEDGFDDFGGFPGMGRGMPGGELYDLAGVRMNNMVRASSGEGTRNGN